METFGEWCDKFRPIPFNGDIVQPVDRRLALQLTGWIAGEVMWSVVEKCGRKVIVPGISADALGFIRTQNPRINMWREWEVEFEDSSCATEETQVETGGESYIEEERQREEDRFFIIEEDRLIHHGHHD